MSYTCWSFEAPAQFQAKVNHMVLPTLGDLTKNDTYIWYHQTSMLELSLHNILK